MITTCSECGHERIDHRRVKAVEVAGLKALGDEAITFEAEHCMKCDCVREMV